MSFDKKDAPSRLVYSTALGRLCPYCGRQKSVCTCRKDIDAQKQQLPKSDGTVRIRLETKGRKGKGVTVVAGIPLPEAELEALGKKLKQKCGSGGTVKENQIEIQGDHRELIIGELTVLGFKVKKTGG